MGKRSIILVTIVLVSLISIALWTKHRNISIEGLGLKILSLTEKDPPRYGYGASINTSSPSHVLWGNLLEKHVSEEGLVDYKSWKDDIESLDTYLNKLSSHPPQKYWNKPEELAYWINAYNAFTVKVILDNYPLESIKDIGGSVPMHNTVWDDKFFLIGSREMSLGDIEHRVLRKHYDEPRIHFAINCASYSCPVLRREAYTKERLEIQLAEQTRSFLADPRKNHLSNEKLLLSPIFKWFSEDFGSDQELITLVNKHSSFHFPADQPFSFMNYNWSLNEKI